MVDGKVVFLPRPTTLVGSQSTTAEFPTQPLDVSQQGGAQFQVWRGPSTGIVRVYLEESLDGVEWVLGPSTPEGYVIAEDDPKFFSYGFRLRWFRLRVTLAYVSVSWPKVTMWAEGLLRSAGSGAWPARAVPATGALMGGMAAPAGSVVGARGSGAVEYLKDLPYAQGGQGKSIDTFLRDASKAGK